jgi:hypothetical protein
MSCTRRGKEKRIMASADKKTRGRTSITGKTTRQAPELGPRKTNPMTQQERMVDVNRGQSAGGGGKHRGDRRDMNKAYTGNARHSARGNTPRVNVATRKA